MSSIDPKLWKQVARSVNEDAIDKLAQEALSSLRIRDERTHRAQQIAHYTLLGLTSLAMLLAIGLSAVAGFELAPVNIEVVRWTWAGFFVGGSATVLHKRFV